jgi:hypothetical protein
MALKHVSQQHMIKRLQVDYNSLKDIAIVWENTTVVFHVLAQQLKRNHVQLM